MRLSIAVTAALMLAGALLPMNVSAQERPDLTIAVSSNPPTLEPAKELSIVGTRTPIPSSTR